MLSTAGMLEEKILKSFSLKSGKSQGCILSTLIQYHIEVSEGAVGQENGIKGRQAEKEGKFPLLSENVILCMLQRSSTVKRKFPSPLSSSSKASGRRTNTGNQSGFFVCLVWKVLLFLFIENFIHLDHILSLLPTPSRSPYHPMYPISCSFSLKTNPNPQNKPTNHWSLVPVSECSWAWGHPAIEENWFSP